MKDFQLPKFAALFFIPASNKFDGHSDLKFIIATFLKVCLFYSLTYFAI